MFEDMPLNLEVPHALGMTTVLVHDEAGDHPWRVGHAVGKNSAVPDYIHHMTTDLAAFLDELPPTKSIAAPPGVQGAQDGPR